MNRAPAMTTLAVAALAGTGCNFVEDPPLYLVSEARVLAITAEPPVLDLEGATTLTPLLVDADGTDTVDTNAAIPDLKVTWRACNPWRLMLDPNVDCGPENSIELAPGDAAAANGLQAELVVLDVLAAFPPPPDALPGGLPIPGGIPGGDTPGEEPAPGEEPEIECPDQYGFAEVPVVMEANWKDQRIVATKRVRVAFESVARRNPALSVLTFGDNATDSSDTLESGDRVDTDAGTSYRLSVSVRRDSLDQACTGGSQDSEEIPSITEESVLVYAYVTDGTLSQSVLRIGYIDDAENADTTTWTAPDDVQETTLWLVAIDGDGGVDWARFSLGGS